MAQLKNNAVKDKYGKELSVNDKVSYWTVHNKLAIATIIKLDPTTLIVTILDSLGKEWTLYSSSLVK